jgi:8-oxo-dGTP diphosphatase
MRLSMVQIGVIIDDKKVLLVKRSKNDSHRAGEWEFPGGELEASESLSLGLKREILEETGIKIEIGLPVYISDLVLKDKGIRYVLVYILCKTIDTNPKIILSPEHTDYKWINIGSVKKENLPEEVWTILTAVKKITF